MDRTSSLALGSVLVGLLVLGLKFLAHALTGSVALLSDALESVINVAAALAALAAVRVSAVPADANHLTATLRSSISRRCSRAP